MGGGPEVLHQARLKEVGAQYAAALQAELPEEEVAKLKAQVEQLKSSPPEEGSKGTVIDEGVPRMTETLLKCLFEKVAAKHRKHIEEEGARAAKVPTLHALSVPR